MRLDVRDLKTPEEHQLAANCRVFLNNQITPRCIMADEEKGEVLVYDIDEKGNMYIDKSTGEPATKSMTGVVKIIKKRDCEND